MTILKGISVFSGVSEGRAFIFRPFEPRVGHMTAGRTFAEKMDAYGKVKARALDELAHISQKMCRKNPEEAAIFTAQQDIINDVAIEEELLDILAQPDMQPDVAIEKVYSKYAALLADVPDTLIGARSADIIDARLRLLRLFEGAKEVSLAQLTEPCIVVAHDLLPSHTAGLARDYVLGIVTESGSTTSHSAIIARSYNIPALVAVEGLTKNAHSGQHLLVDALQGEVILDPTAQQLAAARARTR